MTWAVATFAVLLFAGLPVAFAIGWPTILFILQAGQPGYSAMVGQKLFYGLNSFVLLAAPFFLLAGEIMNKTGISDRLVRFCDLLVGRLRGGLAYVNVLDSCFFAGISGSAISDVMTLGTIMVPTMVKQGYPAAFSAALTAATSVVGPIIPPSVIAALYSAVTGVSLGALYAAGIVPGLLLGLSHAVVVAVKARKHNFPRRTYSIPFREAVRISFEGLVALIMPVIILGGILGGVFTPTEASVVAVVYALVVGFVVLRTLKVSDLVPVLLRAVKGAGPLLFILGVASAFGWVLAIESVPERVAAAVLGVTSSPNVFFLLVILVTLFAGMWIEVGTVAIILGPILSPVAAALGIHPVHFAIVFLSATMLGVATPPVGVCLFASCSIAKVSLEEISRSILPFTLIEVVALVIMVLFPEIVLFVPRYFGMV